MSNVAQSAAEAFERYQIALNADAIIQGAWHKEQDGRQLACGLGVLGDNINDPSLCPAQIMPRWLAQMVPWFFDNQSFDDAKDWGLRFYAELKRIDGKVPFSVVYDWHANFVCQMGMDAAIKRSRDATAHAELKALHERALAGEKMSADEWRPKLKNTYAYAYAYADAYANADANAYAYADAYADANANAYAYAYAYADAYADADKEAAIKILADGIVECLSRVPAPL